MAKSLTGEIRRALTELNPQEVIESSHRPVRVRLKASSEPMYAFLERFLVPAGPADASASMLFRDGHPDAESAELTIVDTQSSVPRGAYVFDPDEPETLVRDILAEHEDLNLALARTFPAFRSAASEKIRHNVSKENAMFAVATALPNIA